MRTSWPEHLPVVLADRFACDGRTVELRHVNARCGRRSTGVTTSRLVASSLVLAESGPNGAVRFRLLETVRQCAAEHLADSGQHGSVHQRHTACFVELARDLGASRPSSPWSDSRRLDNVRGAFRWRWRRGGY